MAHRKVVFRGVDSSYLEECFHETLGQFTELYDSEVSLEQLALSNYTMRAQPIIDWSIFSRKNRKYRVQMSNHVKIAQYIRPAELPREVLVGWFAHELGHIVDYHRRSVVGLIWFIVGYISFASCRMGAERRADLFAIDKGFGKELMATKLYILNQSALPDIYKKRIKRYYMSPDELELLLQGREEERVLF